MANLEINSNPKSLNLDVLKTTDGNVTLGFKCEPNLKLQLAEEAEQLGLTLSSYVNSLVSDGQIFLDMIKEKALKEKDKLFEENKLLLQKIRFYENEILQRLFQEHKDQTLDYKTGDGKTVKHKILDIEDAYTVLINSFKSEK